jgi:hypothetical protein
MEPYAPFNRVPLPILVAILNYAKLRTTPRVVCKAWSVALPAPQPERPFNRVPPPILATILSYTKSRTTPRAVCKAWSVALPAPQPERCFNREDRLVITTALVKAAFAENPRLEAYCKMPIEKKTDADVAAPYVLEALMELVKRAHKNPLARNAYISAGQEDQTQIYVDSHGVKVWEACSLLETTKKIFDTVAINIKRIIITGAERAQLPAHMQSSVSWTSALYDFESDKYVKEARQLMAAHLTRPPIQ